MIGDIIKNPKVGILYSMKGEDDYYNVYKYLGNNKLEGYNDEKIYEIKGDLRCIKI